MTRDEFYAVFTSGQHKHSCPGFDCTECSHVFDLMWEEILSDRKRIVEPLVGNKEYMDKHSMGDTTDWKLQILICDRDETLKRAEADNG